MNLVLPIDHLVVLVRDLNAARRSFVEAGFGATAVARHSEAMGTANSCIMLDGGYIELMGIVAETPANDGWRTLLASGSGLKGFALASEDICATSSALLAKSIDAEPPRHFSRATAAGELRFSVIRVPRDRTPGLQCIYCQHHSRDLLWTPQSMRHANGATRLIEAGAPGVGAMRPFEEKESARAMPVAEADEAYIAIAVREAIPAERLEAIETATGVAIRQGRTS